MKLIEVPTTKQLYVGSGRSHPELASEIADCLGVELGEPNLSEFANGEIHCRYNESIRGADVFIIQSHTHLDGLTLNDSLMEQLIMVDAAKRASAKRITVVAPYYPYSRQDKKGRGREPISARLVADLLKTAGADRVMSVDLHAAQIQGFFDGPVDHLFSIPVLGWAVDGVAYAATLSRAIRAASPPPDLIDAHFEYPDGVGAWLAGKRYGIPVCVTVRGKIVSLSRRALRRLQIAAMLRGVDGRIAVSRSLTDWIHRLAGSDLAVEVIPNGVDPTVYHLMPQSKARQALGWVLPPRSTRTVGHFHRLKGFVGI